MYARDYRAIARERLTGNWKIAILVALLAAMFGGLITGSDFLPELQFNEENAKHSVRIMEGLKVSMNTAGTLNILKLVMGGVIQLGYAQYLLNLHDRGTHELKDLFSQFHRFGDAFCMHLLRTLFITLWSLLLIVPGIIASYNYAMAPYIMLENPNLSPRQVLTASKQMMYGHRFDLFCLHLSFIGWDLLCLLTLDLGHIVLNPYKNAAQTAFYRNISQHPIIY